MKNICLVSCVSKKLPYEAKAKELYVSPLFQKSKAIAEKYFDEWFILSAKHGLVSPNTMIDPYNRTLQDLSANEKKTWGNQTFGELLKHINPQDYVWFFAGENYILPLETLLNQYGVHTETPMRGFSIGKRLMWMNLILRSEDRLKDLFAFYDLLNQLSEGYDGGRVLSTCSGGMDWPKRGVYFIFENGENRRLATGQRVVRVGTHAVSNGSNSTLWSRIKTHIGTSDGLGNHRSSIFRQHVGISLLNKYPDLYKSETWEKKDYVLPAFAFEEEKKIEAAVSQYIKKMRILWINVPDEPGKQSDRSYIEMNAIALLSGISGPIDVSSSSWLGRYRNHWAILKSSLWNVNFVDINYDSRFLEVFYEYVKITLNKSATLSKSIAPINWYFDLCRKNYRQSTLFYGDRDE